MKRYLALFLSAVLLISVFSAAGFAANETDTDTEAVLTDSEELLVLKGLGFIEEDYAETEEKISRAEAVSGLMNVVGLGTLSDGGIFSDVAEDSEYLNDIYEAYERAYVKGTGDGKFEPEEPIKAVDLRNVAVGVLGWGDYALHVGYDKAAVKLGLLKGVETDGEYVTKKGFAKFLYNMLHADYPEISGFGDDGISYEFDSGKIFLNKFDIYTAEGVLEAEDLYSTDGEVCGLGYAVIDGEKFEKPKSFKDVKVGLNVKYYYKTDKDADISQILYMAPCNGKIYEINLEDVYALNGTQISYYDENGKTKRLNLAPAANILYNYAPMSPFKPERILGKEGTVYLVDNGEGKITTLIAEIGESYFVSYADSDEKVIYDKRGKKPLDLSDYDVIRVVNNDKETDFSAISPLSVVTVYLTDENVSKSSALCFVSSAKFAGKITKTSDDGEYTVYDKVYKTEAGYEENRKAGLKYSPVLSVGTTAMFYLDINGKIVAADTEGYDGFTYGLLISAGTKGKLDKTVMFRIFDANEKFETYDCNEKITYNGKRIDAEKALAAFEASFSSAAEKCKLIKFELDDDMKINEVMNCYSQDADKAVEFNHEYKNSTKWRDANIFQDTATNQNSYGVMTSTVIFQAPETFGDDFKQSYEEKNFSVYSMSDLVQDDVEYQNTQIYDADDVMGAGCVVIRRAVSENYTQHTSFMYVNDVETQKRDDETVPALNVIYNGKEGVYFGAEAETLKEVKKGDVIQPILNANGEIKYFKVIFRFADTQPSGNEAYMADLDADGTKETVITQYSGKENLILVGRESGTDPLRNTCVTLYGTLVGRNDYGFTATYEGNTLYGDIPYFRLMTNYIMVCEETRDGHRYRTGTWDELRPSSPGATDGSKILLNTRNQKCMEFLLFK